MDLKQQHAAYLEFSKQNWADWRASYLAQVKTIAEADQSLWMTPDFQKLLWEHDGISSVGLGGSVVVTGAYQDAGIAQKLWELRSLTLPEDVATRSALLSQEFNVVMRLVHPRHNPRRPGARLTRIFMAMFPYDVLCLADDYRTYLVRRELGLKKQKQNLIGQQVRVRRAIAEALGTPLTLEAAISQSIFSWYLLEEVIRPREEEKDEEVSVLVESRKVVEIVRLLPMDQQRRGLPHLKGVLNLCIAMVRSAETGATTTEILDAGKSIAPSLNTGSLKNILSAVRALGLLELRGGAYHPTLRGQALLDGEEPSDVLSSVLIRRVFGFAQLLRELSEAGGSIQLSEIPPKLQAWYINWTSQRAPRALVGWSQEVGLTERYVKNKWPQIRLTEVGEEWAARLPADLGAWRLEAAEENTEELDGGGEAGGTTSWTVPDFSALQAHFASDAQLSRLVLPDGLLGLLHGALHANARKHFVLLSGLSGTGKTSIARAYAQACCALSGLKRAVHYLQVAVRPDWTDPSGLLGYFNPLGDPPVFQSTPTLRFLMQAADAPDKPFFLCLDEMNLARVEHYFAPFLSAMEGGDLPIHAEDELVDTIPSTLPWPKNLYILGTVNMDETTHAFSDKVLDRAFTFELWDIQIDVWRNRRQAAGADGELLDALIPVLTELHDALYPVRRHFGYRTCDEVYDFLRAVPDSITRTVAMDAAVLAKVLPKVRGDDVGGLPEALEALHSRLRARKMSRSAAKVGQMRQTLQQTGMVRFFS